LFAFDSREREFYSSQEIGIEGNDDMHIGFLHGCQNIIWRSKFERGWKKKIRPRHARRGLKMRHGGTFKAHSCLYEQDNANGTTTTLSLVLPEFMSSIPINNIPDYPAGSGLPSQPMQPATPDQPD